MKYMKWIKVEDILPEPNEKVLLYFGKIDNILMGIYWEDVNKFNVFFSNGATLNDGKHAEIITHWMPLPEPPKEDNLQRFMQKHGLSDEDMINDNKPTDI